MKKQIFYIALFATILAGLSGCKKFLDINSDPDTPQFPDPSSVFPTQLAAIPRGFQFDARYVGRYIQNWNSSTTATAANINWDRLGYASGVDNNGDIWRQTYFGTGQNLNYIIDNGIKNSQWDYVGAAYALKALMFQTCTDYHGEIIFSDAFKDSTSSFKYDSQESVYRGVDSLCRLALRYLERTDLSPGASKLAKGDYVYNGDAKKWMKFVWGLLARNYHHISNKTGLYKPDSVIAFCDRALTTFNDDFLIPFDAQKNDDTNFFGTYRDNLTVFRQSNYIVKLLDGTTLAGNNSFSNRDPRLKHMLSASHDTANGNGGYRGVDPGAGDPFIGLDHWYRYLPTSANYMNARRKVAAPWGDTLYYNPSSSNFSTNFKKYLFGDKVVEPVMTASEILFIKAEAALKKDDRTTAYNAYIAGINAHFDFINRTSFNRGNTQLFVNNPIPASERNAYLSGAAVKKDPSTLTYSDILLQKYISLWGWGFFETWVDLRRWHYTDPDPITGQQAYTGFVIPQLAPENLNKLVYRVRPRFNSEYVWNRTELQRIGALNSDYHTYETWFSKP